MEHMELHTRVDVVGRSPRRGHNSNGAVRTCCGSAAYRCGIDIDGVDGTEYRYSRKQGVLDAWQMLPDNAPERYLDIGTMWREADSTERRKDAQLYRDVEVSMPNEFDIERARALLEELMRPYIRMGMAATIAIHRPHKRDSDAPENLHAHIMLTMREMTPDGFGKKNREWNRSDYAAEIRKRWAELCNAELQRMGVEKVVEWESYAARGIDKIPGMHEGPAVTAMRRRGELTDKAVANDVATQLNNMHAANQKRLAEAKSSVDRAIISAKVGTKDKARLEARIACSKLNSLRHKLNHEVRRNRKIAECWDLLRNPKGHKNATDKDKAFARKYLRWAGYDPDSNTQYRSWKRSQKETSSALRKVDRLDERVRSALAREDYRGAVLTIAEGIVDLLFGGSDGGPDSLLEELLEWLFGGRLWQILQAEREEQERRERIFRFLNGLFGLDYDPDDPMWRTRMTHEQKQDLISGIAACIVGRIQWSIGDIDGAMATNEYIAEVDKRIKAAEARMERVTATQEKEKWK